MKKRALMGLAVGLAMSGSAGMATTAWYDDFDSYTPGNELPSPWVDGTNGNGVRATDYPGGSDYSAAFYFGDPNNYDWGASFRPLEAGEGIAYARMRRRPFGGAQLALTQTTENYRNGIQFNDDSVRIHFDDWRNTRNQAIAWVRVNGANEMQSADFNIQEDQWYDVRITYSADHRDFTFEYKRDIESTWTLGLQHTASEEMTLNYVGIGSAVFSSGDSHLFVGVVPEPSAFALLALGGGVILHLRRRARLRLGAGKRR